MQPLRPSARRPAGAAAQAPAAPAHAPAAPAAARTVPPSRRARAFADDGLLYIRSFFAPDVFEAVKAECALLRPRLRRERSSTAENRLGAYLPALGATRRAFGGERALASLRAATGESGLALSDYPAEVRLYPVGGAMAWHRDEQLYEAPQVEGVLTVANSSDSETEWLDAAGRLHSLWTEPNSLLLVRAQGALHRVRGVGRGERAIVKVVLTTEAGSPRLAAYESTLATTYDA